MYRDFLIAVSALIALSIVIFWGKSYETSLRGIDSNIHASAAMSATTSQFFPKLPIRDVAAGEESVSYFNDHPFFLFWLNGIIMRALGPASWSARLVSAFFSVGCVILTLILGIMMGSRVYGMAAALLFLFCRDIILTGAGVTLDMPLLFFVLLTFVLWWRKRWVATGIVAGIGLWVKTPVVLLIFPSALVLSFIHHRHRDEWKRVFLSASIALGIGSLVWIATGLLGGWQLVFDYWSRQVWGTAVGGRNFEGGRNWFLFFEMVKRGYLPGLPFLILGLIKIYRDRLWKQEGVQLSFVAIGILAATITLMKFKYDYYYNPAFPFLSLIAAFSVKDWLQTRERAFYTTLAMITPPVLAVLLCTPISFGQEPFVALKRFEPLIQSYGKCSDQVLIVPGGEPLGSHLDYRVHVAFYTGKSPILVPCEVLDLRIRDLAKRGKVGWLVISEDNLGHCLSPANRQRFTTTYRVGNQFLLTDIIPKSEVINLTPLEREGLAVEDCKPASYPQDRYHRYTKEDL